MKQPDDALSLRITGEPPRSLAQRTGDAGKRQIRGSRLTAFPSGDDMIDVKRRLLRTLGEQTVLTDILGSITHFLDQFRRDVRAHSLFPRRSLCTKLEQGEHVDEFAQRFRFALFRVD